MSVHDWFGDWHREHLLRHPHPSWVRYDSFDGAVFYDGWIAAFEEKGITREEALAASTYLQRDSPGFPERHLKAILGCMEIVRQRLRDSKPAAPTGDLEENRRWAIDQAAGCPECDGSGWAERKCLVTGFEAPFVVRLYCRCAYGLWREMHRGPDDLRPNGEQNYESLQALPELWRRDWEHSSWSDVPTQPLVGPLPNITYLGPDDPRGLRPSRSPGEGLVRRASQRR